MSTFIVLPSLNIHKFEGHTALLTRVLHTQRFFLFADLQHWHLEGHLFVLAGSSLQLGSTSPLPVGVSASAGTSAAPSVGRCHQGAKSWCHTDCRGSWRGEGLHNSRRADFPGPGPPSWPVPRRWVPAAFLFLIFLLSPSPFPAEPPNPPSSGQPPSHTRFWVESMTVKREESRDWAAERRRGILSSSGDLFHVSSISCLGTDHEVQQTQQMCFPSAS